MGTLLKVEHVYYSSKEIVFFGKRKKHSAILKDISFELDHGDVLGIVGESGSGKTTLAKVICGILEHDKGEIKFKSKSGHRKPGIVQILFQNTNELINPLRRVGDLLNESFLDKKRLDEICRLLDIKKDQFGKIGYQLSGGERQRVGLARILSASPELLILDEPFSAQDQESQGAFLNLFNKLKNELEIAMICVSHDIKLLRKIADKMIVMFGGKIMEIGDSETIFNLHRHPYTSFLNNAFNYQLSGDIFCDIPESAALSDQGCAYYTRCGNRSAVCLEHVEELNSDKIKTYCNFPL